jgi:hypothetical protein
MNSPCGEKKGRAAISNRPGAVVDEIEGDRCARRYARAQRALERQVFDGVREPVLVDYAHVLAQGRE